MMLGKDEETTNHRDNRFIDLEAEEEVNNDGVVGKPCRETMIVRTVLIRQIRDPRGFNRKDAADSFTFSSHTARVNVRWTFSG